MKMKNKKALQWLPVLYGFASSSSFFFILISSTQALADHTGDSVTDNIRIDCGARMNSTDQKTNFSYRADHVSLVEYGEAHNVSSNFSNEQIGKQLKTLRSFPEGKRNCYTVPIPSKNTKHLVRAFFAYGNYADKTRIPSFDLYIGVNYWANISEADGNITRFEVIHVSPTDDINVCLVDTGHGTPFISLLEVLPWQNTRYDQTASGLLYLMSRSKLGMSEEDSTFISYPDDVYGRSWFNRQMGNSVRISTSMGIDDSNSSENTYKLPKEVLTSAVKSVNSSPLVINVNYPPNDTSDNYYVYLHFYDFVNKSQQRKMVITFSDGVNVSFTLEYRKPTTLVRNIKREYRVSSISIGSTPDSQLPAMLNAYEIYRVLPANSTTDEGDVAAIQHIKDVYGIKRISWQGDPCRPMNYKWEGLNCNEHGTPRITSINLSSSNLTGIIAPSFSNFTELKVLDLSNNNLTGKIPESLAAPATLKDINLTRNKLDGPIPKLLVEKTKNGSLNLSTDDLKEHKNSTGHPKEPKDSTAKEVAIVVGATGGAAAISGVTLTLTLRPALRPAFCCRSKKGSQGNGRRGQNDDERRSGRKEEDSKDDKNDEERVVNVKPTIREALRDKASEAVEQISCL